MEMSGTMIKVNKYLKFQTKTYFLAPIFPVNPLRPQSPHCGLDADVLPSQPQLSPQS